jgi:glycosyltransferase involved in cell wall biosynthesis
MNPKVTFIVPCYKLAHLLPDCISSILAQTFADFEVLIMDDASPDRTPEVAASFKDPRVRHIRNQPNLGHLRNYNKGIGLSRGEYVWLISADDYLRRPYVLQRYVDLMDGNPEVGFVFCPGVKVRGGREVETLGYSLQGTEDRIFDGRKFLSRLIRANTIVAASGMVRKKCYDSISVFPLDMPWGGDWYLWCVFSLATDVGYLAEPMVCYREHELSMTTKLMNQDVDQCSREDITMPWIIKRKVEEAGYPQLVSACLLSAAKEYATRLAGKRYKSAAPSMTLEQFEESLSNSSSDEKVRKFVRARVFADVADIYYWQHEDTLARQFYSLATRTDRRMPAVWLKRLLLSAGELGGWIRSGRARLRQRAAN